MSAAIHARRSANGFTLVELMVALTGGLFVSLAVFALARDSGRFYQREARIANATIGGHFIPLLTLGIPGSGATAIILGAFLLHGVQPGPQLFSKDPALVYAIFASLPRRASATRRGMPPSGA